MAKPTGIKRVDKFVEFDSSNRVVKEREGGGTVGVEIIMRDELGQAVTVALDYRNFVMMMMELGYYMIET